MKQKLLGMIQFFFFKKSENLEVGPKNINFLHYLKNWSQSSFDWLMRHIFLFK